MADIYIISGFLGAGKTTLIQKLLKEFFTSQRVVLIENDFGEISIDSALLKGGGIEVKEINSGCICCSLFGDFVKAIGEIESKFHPDSIIIEPSGVGKLSDVARACADPRILPLAQVKIKVTVVDVNHAHLYLANFGEFFADQVNNADIILLSRCEKYPEKIESAVKLIKTLNAKADIITVPWSNLAAEAIFAATNNLEATEESAHDHMEGDALHDSEHCHCDAHDHEHNHNHEAEDIFDTITIRTNKVFSADELRERFSLLERQTEGTILRGKGIVHSRDGYLNVQYLPGEIEITDCATSGGTICLIGRDLNQEDITNLFNHD